jgi:hypothetical protein
VGVILLWSAGQSTCWTRTTGSLILFAAGGAPPVAPLIVLPQPKKAGSSDALEPPSSAGLAGNRGLGSIVGRDGIDSGMLNRAAMPHI